MIAHITFQPKRLLWRVSPMDGRSGLSRARLARVVVDANEASIRQDRRNKPQVMAADGPWPGVLQRVEQFRLRAQLALLSMHPQRSQQQASVKRFVRRTAGSRSQGHG
jgi:hypothetical protein